MADQPQIMSLAEFQKRQKKSAVAAKKPTNGVAMPLATYLRIRADQQERQIEGPYEGGFASFWDDPVAQAILGGAVGGASLASEAAGRGMELLPALKTVGTKAAEFVLGNELAQKGQEAAEPLIGKVAPVRGPASALEHNLLSMVSGILPFGAAAALDPLEVRLRTRTPVELPPPRTPVGPVWQLPPDLKEAFPEKPPQGTDILSKPTPEIGKTPVLTREPGESVQAFERRNAAMIAQREADRIKRPLSVGTLPFRGKTPVVMPSRARATGELPSLPAEVATIARPEKPPIVPPTTQPEAETQPSMFGPPSKAEQAASDTKQQAVMDADRAHMEALEKEVEQLRKQAQERPARPDKELAQAAGAQRPIRGKPYFLRRPDIGVDPERFQFKRDVQKGSGAGRALSRIKVWNPESAGLVLVWRDPEGKFWTVNGHHRVALYDRLVAEGREVPEGLWVQILDSGSVIPDAVASNVTDSEARTVGAMVNLRDGKGTALDAAKVLRESGMDEAKLDAAGVDMTEGSVQRARSLASLAAPLWRKAVLEQIPQDWLVEIGQKLPGDEANQLAALKMIEREREAGKRVTGERVADLIDLIKGSTQQQQITADLFGAQQTSRSLVTEKADIIEAVRERLRFQKRVFGTAAKNAEALGQADVASVNVARGAGLSKEAAQNLLIFDKLAKKAGTQTSAAINLHAEELAGAKTRAAKDAVMQRAYNDAVDAARRDLGGGESGTELNAAVLPIPQALKLLRRAGRRIAETEQYQRAANVLRDARSTALSFAAPEQISTDARETHRVAVRIAAEGAASLFKLERTLAGPIRRWFKTSLASNDPEYLHTATVDVWRAISYDHPFPEYLAKLEPWRPVIRDVFDRTFELMNSVKNGAVRYRRDYFPLFWEKPEQVKAILSQLRKRSLRGPMGFLKERSFETEYLLRHGFKFRFNNPGDLIMAGLINEWRFVMGNKLFEELKGRELVKLFADQGQAERQGWVAINDSIAHQYAEGEEGAVNYVGRYYAPADVARVINNMLAPDPSGHALYRLVNHAITGINTFRVSFGAFHYLLVSGADIAMTRIGTGLRSAAEGLAARDPRKVLNGIVQVPRGLLDAVTLRAFREDTRYAGRMIHELLEPGAEGPDIARSVEMAIRGGARFTSERYLDSLMHSAETIVRGISADMPLSQELLDTMAKPLMGWYVPRIKLAAGMRLLRDNLTRAYDNGITVDQEMLDRMAQDAFRHVDDMLGQMVGDNFALHPATRAVMRLLFAFPQFQIGTIRAGVGAVRGAAKTVLGRETTELERMSMSTVAGTLITVGTFNSMLQYALTRTFPHTMKELFIAPWDGSIGQNGERGGIHWPNYVVPWVELLTAPWQFLESRFGQLPRDIQEIIQNKDWRNVQILDPDAPYTQQALQAAARLFPDTFAPFVLSSAQRMTRAGIGAREPKLGGVSPLAGALSFMGVAPAPYSLSMTADEKLMQNYLRQDFPSIRDPRQVEVDDLKRDFLTKYRKGQHDEALHDLSQALAARKVSDRQVKGWLSEVHQHPDTVAFKRLKHLDQAVRVYLSASPAHRALYKDALLHKLGLTPNARGQFRPPTGAEMQRLRDEGLLQKLLATLRDEREEQKSPPESIRPLS